MSSYWISGKQSNKNVSKRQKDTDMRRPREMGSIVWSDAAMLNGTLEPPGAAEAGKVLL